MKYSYIIIFILQGALFAQFHWENDTATDSIENEVFPTPNVPISLGEWCGVTMAIRDSGLNTYAYPFDWLLSVDFDAIINLIEHDFEEYMAMESLRNLDCFDQYLQEYNPTGPGCKHAWVYEKRYGIESRHDFLNNRPLEDSYTEALDKITRRIRRLCRTLSRTDITVYFFRSMLTKEQAIRFRDLIRDKFPSLSFMLVALGKTEDFKENWKEHYVYNYYYPFSLFNYDPLRNKYINNPNVGEGAGRIHQIMRELKILK